MRKKLISVLLVIALVIPMTPAAYSATTVPAYLIVENALSLVGKYPYVSGKQSPEEGFDCSGFVWYVYNQMSGVNISLWQAGRSRSGLESAGTKIIGISNFLPGDIIQFNGDHVGIYIGNSMSAEAANSAVGLISRKIYDSEVAYAIRLASVTQADPVAPTTASLTIDSSEMLIGEAFTLRFSANQPCRYYLSIFDADSGELIVGDTVDSRGIYQNSFLRCGHYCTYMSAFNPAGAKDSNWVDFWVFGPDAPTSAVLSTSAPAIRLGESIVFTNWMNAYYAKYYMTIYDSGTDALVDEGWKPASYTFTPQKAGEYSAHMSAYTKPGTAHSNWVTFRVFGDSVDLGSAFYARISSLETRTNLADENGNVQTASGGNSTSDLRQIWKFERQTDGSYLIRNMDDQDVMQVENGSVNDGTNIETGSPSGTVTAAQKWFIEKSNASADDYILISPCGNKLLELSAASNAQLCTYSSGKKTQRFQITKTELPVYGLTAIINEAGALSYSVSVPAGTSGTLIIAGYETSGKLIATHLLPVSTGSGTLPLPFYAPRYRVFLVDSATFAPLCKAVPVT